MSEILNAACSKDASFGGGNRAAAADPIVQRARVTSAPGEAGRVAIEELVRLRDALAITASGVEVAYQGGHITPASLDLAREACSQIVAIALGSTRLFNHWVATAVLGEGIPETDEIREARRREEINPWVSAEVFSQTVENLVAVLLQEARGQADRFVITTNPPGIFTFLDTPRRARAASAPGLSVTIEAGAARSPDNIFHTYTDRPRGIVVRTAQQIREAEQGSELNLPRDSVHEYDRAGRGEQNQLANGDTRWVRNQQWFRNPSEPRVAVERQQDSQRPVGCVYGVFNADLAVARRPVTPVAEPAGVREQQERESRQARLSQEAEPGGEAS
eukprot:jgi/Mesvir1/6262/Mv13853-RA.1